MLNSIATVAKLREKEKLKYCSIVTLIMNYYYEFRKSEREDRYSGNWNLPTGTGVGFLGSNCDDVVKSILENLVETSLFKLELASPTARIQDLSFGWTRITDDELGQIYNDLSKKRPDINFVITHVDKPHVIRL